MPSFYGFLPLFTCINESSMAHLKFTNTIFPLLVLSCGAVNGYAVSSSEVFTSTSPERRVYFTEPSDVRPDAFKRERTKPAQAEEEIQTSRENLISQLRKAGYPLTAEGLVNAARRGKKTIVELFLQADLSVNAFNSGGDTPLTAAASANQFAIARHLIEHGADVNLATRDGNANSPLILAARRGHGGIVNLLLDNGADVNKTNSDDWPPLFYAVNNNDLTMSALFIKVGAKVNYESRIGLTALMISAKAGYEDMTYLLLKSGADFNATDFAGNTPLFHAVLQHNYATTQILLEVGSDPNMQNSSGLRPLDLALNKGYLDIANLLLAYGANRPKRFGLGR